MMAFSPSTTKKGGIIYNFFPQRSPAATGRHDQSFPPAPDPLLVWPRPWPTRATPQNLRGVCTYLTGPHDAYGCLNGADRRLRSTSAESLDGLPAALGHSCDRRRLALLEDGHA